MQRVVGLLRGLERPAPVAVPVQVRVDRDSCGPVSFSRRAMCACMRASSIFTTLRLLRPPGCGSPPGSRDQVVELDLRLEVEVRLQRVDQLPLRRAPAVLAHPGALGDVELRLRRRAACPRISGRQAAAVELDAAS